MLDRQDRKLEVDLLKTAGIVAVVVIHSLRDFWNPDFTASELWIGQMMRFGVPAFLAVSGFLYAASAGSPASGSSIGPRLQRILIPYLVASCGAIALGLWQGQLSAPPGYLVEALIGSTGDPSSSAHTAANIALDLLLGNAFGPYYYVLVITFFVLLSPWMATLRPRALTALLLLALALQIVFEGGFWYWNDFFWHVRNPLLWGGYFVTGWWLRIHSNSITRAVQQFRGVFVLGAVALVSGCATLLAFESTGTLPHAVIQLTAWVGVYAILFLLLIVAWGRNTRSIWLARVSDLTYTIYLFHLFVLYPLRKSIGGYSEGFDPGILLGIAAASFALPFFIALGLRSLFGERTRTWIGA